MGELFAFASALSWSFAVILFRRALGGAETTALAANVYKSLGALLLMSLTWAISDALFGATRGPGLGFDRSAENWLRLVASGVLGISISDVLFFHALSRLGPGRLTVVECAYAPAIVLFSVPLLGERPGAGVGLGALLVAGGVLVVTWPGRRPAQAPNPREAPVAGALFGLASMLTVALAIVIAKPAFQTGSLAEVAAIRLFAGCAALLAYALPSRARRAELAGLRSPAARRALLPATFLGSWLSAFCWVGGFKYADASTAAVLNQTTTVFTLLLARVLLGEPLTPRRLTGVVLGFAGALVVVLSRA